MGRIAFRARPLRAPSRVADQAKWALVRLVRSAINPVAIARAAHRGTRESVDESALSGPPAEAEDIANLIAWEAAFTYRRNSALL